MSKAHDETKESQSTTAPDDDVEHLSETRGERWMKYGMNVLLTSLLVVVLAFLAIWGAQRYRSRGDLTQGGSYSLKPQTVTVISDLKQPVKLVSLYPRLKQEPGKRNNQGAQQQEDFYQPVDDILQEYRRKGKNIEVDSIDPAAEPAKLDRWLVEVTNKYGGNVKNYRELLTSFPETLKQIRTLSSEEANKMRQIHVRGAEVAEEQAETLNAAYSTVLQFPALIQMMTGGIEEELKEKIPDYKGRVQAVESSLGMFSRQVEAVRKALESLQGDEKAPQPIRDYAKNSLGNYDAMKKHADDVLAKIKGLGELKLDEVRRRLVAPEGEQPAPAIAVMGENDIKLIDFKDVWKSGESTGFGTGTQGPPRLRFAGEQQLTAAILALAQPQKTKIAFIRGGGSPKTTGGGPFGGGGGDYSEMAERLRTYNFEVLEKDVSGQSAQRAMMGGMPPPQNEPTDEQIKDAIWVVFSEPQTQMTQFGPMPGAASPELGNKLREHLDRGGAALVLVDLQGDDLSEVLKDYGVEVKSNVVAVHEPIRTDAEAVDDFIEQARRQPPIFVINEFGGPHPITSTLASLDAALVPMMPVNAPGAEGAQITRIIPVPQEPRSWGESDIPSVSRRGSTPTYDPASGDIAGPLFCGAVVEKKDKGRLVVIGCAQFANNLMLTIPDQKLLRQKVEVARFPGNGELFTNSIFWLGKMEKMIALSPSALDTPRIAPIAPGTLAFWRIGVLLIGLPALALAAGFVVWRSRRD